MAADQDRFLGRDVFSYTQEKERFQKDLFQFHAGRGYVMGIFIKFLLWFSCSLCTLYISVSYGAFPYSIFTGIPPFIVLLSLSNSIQSSCSNPWLYIMNHSLLVEVSNVSTCAVHSVVWNVGSNNYTSRYNSNVVLCHWTGHSFLVFQQCQVNRQICTYCIPWWLNMEVFIRYVLSYQTLATSYLYLV